MLQIPLVEGNNITVQTIIYDTTYKFVINWNSRFKYYSIDVIKEEVEIYSGMILVSGVDLATVNDLGFTRLYCINKNDYNEDIEYTGLGDDGIVVIIEDSDLEDSWVKD